MSRFVFGLLLATAACVSCADSQRASTASAAASSATCLSPPFPKWTLSEAEILPQDRSLARPEDGKALPDDRLVVVDEEHGLRVIDPDGSNRPFGGFEKAGYRHNPPESPAGANGMYLERDNRHLLVSDVYTGKIYRVDLDTETTRLVYDHPYGVNAVIRDSRGTIWFTQSANNPAENSVGILYGSLDVPVPTGGVFKLPGSGDQVAAEAEEVVSGIYFANGIVLDNSEHYLYVSELMMDRVLRYQFGIETATVSNREVYQSVANRVFVVDDECRNVHSVFHAASAKNTAVLNQWVERSHLGQPRLELIGPDAWDPLSGFLTGMFFSADQTSVYFTSLGNAILRFAMP
jgi:sugar lactone lactonase YvrE